MKEVNQMKRLISAILVFTMFLSLSVLNVKATEAILFSDSSSVSGDSGGSGSLAISSGGSVGGGGSSGSGSSGRYIVPVSVKEYNVSGTIYLPSGATAPKGGLKIYGGFGGVSYSEIKLASVSSDEYFEEESTVDYESVEIIATIPEGQNYVNYSATCTISSSYNGIYGKFWIYDNVTLGNKTLSNKQTLSAPVNLKA